MKYWKITTTTCLTLVLAGCGGSSGGGSDDGGDDSKVIVKTLEAYQHSDVYNKGSSRMGTGESESGLIIASQPKHGTVEAYFVGNEMWDFNYTSTDCFEGSDSYLYQIGNEYGENSINVKSALEDLTISAEVGTTKTIDLSASLPTSFESIITLTQPEHGSNSYDAATKLLTYTASSSATSDSFTYAVNGCAKTITANVSQPPQLLALYSDEFGTELWKTDGTVAGTQLVKDINPGVNGSGPYSIIKRPSDGLYLFIAQIDSIRGIWRTDGTEGNTKLVKEITQQVSYRTLPHLVLVGEDFYFMSKTESTLYLWKTNGEITGTEIVKEMTATGGADASGYMHTVNGKVIFARDTSAPGPGTEPWVSNGSASGTIELKNIWTGDSGSNFMKGSVIEFEDKLFSSANDYTHGPEIWMTDGTPNNTTMFINLEPETAGNHEGSYPGNFTAADDVFYFTAVTSDKGDQLWKSDGTQQGTVAVKDLDPTSAVRNQDLLGADFFYGRIKQGSSINGLLFFTLFNDTNGRELWKSDGTETGTVMVKDLFPGLGEYQGQPAPYNSNPGDFVELDNVLYFSAYAEDNSRNLWRSDGTEQGTVMVKSFGPDELQPGGIEVKGGFMLLTIRKGNPDEEGGSDYQLWRSDGTEAGTYFLADIQ